MDPESPYKGIEENTEESGASVAGDIDLDLLNGKEEILEHKPEEKDDVLQVDSNIMYAGSPMAPPRMNDEGMQYSTMASNSPGPSPPSKITESTCLPLESNLEHDMVDRASYYSTEMQRSPLEDNGTHNINEVSNFVGLSDDPLDNGNNGTFKNKIETEDLDPSAPNSFLKIEDQNGYELVNHEAFNHQSEKSPTFNETVNEDFENTSGNPQYEKAEFVKEEVDGGIYTHHSDDKGPQTDDKDGDYSEMVTSENGGIGSQKVQNTTSSPEKQLPATPQRSPQDQPSTVQEECPSPGNSDRKAAPSPSPSKRRRSPSPEKHNVRQKKASSRDHLSPSTRHKSPSNRSPQRDSHHRDSSPRKRLSASPRRRHSPRRRDRSASRSPARRRDSSRHRRDHRGRSRSRSPYSRDRDRRSPRRRHSPRRRSPPSSYSRRRSPRRPWAPPANRNTGIGKPGNNLFVAGFSYVTTERDLEKKFSRFGRVIDVRVVRDKRTGDSRGFGFISLEKDEDADAAIRALDQTEWNSRIVLVEKSKTPIR